MEAHCLIIKITIQKVMIASMKITLMKIQMIKVIIYLNKVFLVFILLVLAEAARIQFSLRYILGLYKIHSLFLEAISKKYI